MNNTILQFQNKQKVNHKIKRVNPHLSWIILLRFVFAIIIILMGGSLYLMYQIKNDQIFNKNYEPEIPTSVLDKNLLDKVNKIFSNRDANKDVIESNDLLYKDPSLR